jgi:hypothetical protein
VRYDCVGRGLQTVVGRQIKGGDRRPVKDFCAPTTQQLGLFRPPSIGGYSYGVA